MYNFAQLPPCLQQKQFFAFMPFSRPRVIVAETAGFCMGVRRATELALKAANDPSAPRPIRTLGPLIHNHQVIGLLETKGVGSVEEDEIPEGGTALIRAHGIPPDRKEQLQGACGKVIDATCPHVKRVQRIADRFTGEGWHCVVVGDAGHAEVRSVLSHAHGRGHVVAGPEELDDLPEMEQVVLVAQTTQSTEVYEKVAEEARQHWSECRVFDTICRSTERRQQEVRELADQTEAIVVVGGHHSANTRRLAEISSATGVPTRHVETPDQLDEEWILKFDTVGVSAGASTPGWMITRVVRKIREVQRSTEGIFARGARQWLGGLVHSNLFLGGGAAALTLANAVLMGMAPGTTVVLCCVLSFFFILAQHLLNQYAKREAIYLHDPGKGEFFKRYERPLLALGVGSLGCALGIALSLGWAISALIAAGSLAGVLYRVEFSSRLTEAMGIRSLQQIPASKEIFVSLAWGVTGALVPALAGGTSIAGWGAVAVAFAFSMLLAGQRTLTMDFRELETDQLIGRETVVVALGQKAATWLYGGALGVMTALLVCAGLLVWTGPFAYALLLVVPCAAGSFLALSGRAAPDAEVAEMLVDGAFYLAGVLSLLWLAA